MGCKSKSNIIRLAVLLELYYHDDEEGSVRLYIDGAPNFQGGCRADTWFEALSSCCGAAIQDGSELTKSGRIKKKILTCQKCDGTLISDGKNWKSRDYIGDWHLGQFINEFGQEVIPEPFEKQEAGLLLFHWLKHYPGLAAAQVAMLTTAASIMLGSVTAVQLAKLKDGETKVLLDAMEI